MTVNCYFKSMSEKRYTIEDLQEITGFTRRTIRYYIQEGLLEPPAGRGRGGFYFDSHRKRLSEIRALQEKGLKLAAIAELLKMGPEPELQEAEPLRPERQIWIRYPIEQGIEIQISRDLEEQDRKKVAEIVRIAKSILKKGGEQDE
jgi:DNA-binding transcriptional MerR regulator